MYMLMARKIGIPLIMLLVAGMYYLEVRGGSPRDQMLIKPVVILMGVLFVVNAAWDIVRVSRSGGEASASEDRDSLKKMMFFSCSPWRWWRSCRSWDSLSDPSSSCT